MPQIHPNPNAKGKTINVNSNDWYNWGDSKDQFLNNGVINISNSGRLTNETDLTNWATLNNNGVIQNSGYFDNSFYWPGSRAVFNNNGQFFNYGGSVLSNWGSFNNKKGSTLEMLMDSKGRFGVVDNYGTLTNHEGASLNIRGGLLNNYGGKIENKGSILNELAGTLHTTSTFHNYGVITNNALIDIASGEFINENDAVIQGTGSTRGTLINKGTISGGASAGGYLIDGNLHHLEDADLVIELEGYNDSNRDQLLTEYDFIDVKGDLIINGGTLEVSLINDFKLHRGQKFLISQVDGNLNGEFLSMAEGESVGMFDSIYGNKIDLFISYQAGDGNDISLYTLESTNPDMIFNYYE